MRGKKVASDPKQANFEALTDGNRSKDPKSTNGANLDFEQKLWRAADKMRSNMDAAEYKHVVLGLIFLKYASLLQYCP